MMFAATTARVRRAWIQGVLIVGMCWAGCAWGNTNIAAGTPYAWAENAGWVTLRGDCLNGVIATGTSYIGFAWSESVGWINFGDGTNTNPNAFGVFDDGLGNLSGFAWGENIGWIDFDTLDASGSHVTVDAEGVFAGFAWSENIGWINFASGYGVALNPNGAEEGECPPLPVEGEGQAEGSTEGVVEGQTEGATEGVVEGQTEGAAEGVVEGLAEGIIEGEGQPAAVHTADQDGDGVITLTELLRVIQFFNLRAFHCQSGTEDGYAPLTGDTSCAPHDSDYNPQNWVISLTELLRLIQFFNLRGYHACPESGTEDGFCPGLI